MVARKHVQRTGVIGGLALLAALALGGARRARYNLCQAAMARIEGEIIIHRPVEEVFDFVADERNEPRYNPRMVSAELMSGEPIGLASRFRAELKTGRRTMPMMVEFTEFDRPRRLASSTHSSMMETTGALTFEPRSEGTRMRWSWDVQPRGVLRLMPALVGLIGRRQEQSIWGNLKRLLEADLDRS